MAFEAFLQQPVTKGSRGRALAFAGAFVLHGGLAAGGVARSFWTVDELVPPSVAVRVIALAHAPRLEAAPSLAALAPAPAPTRAAAAREPQLDRAARRAPAAPAPATPPRATAPEPPAATPVPASGVAAEAEPPSAQPSAPAEPLSGPPASGGSAEVPGGTPAAASSAGGGGLPAAGGGPARGVSSGRPKFLPESLAKLQRIGGAWPEFPRLLAQAGVIHIVQAKVCVDGAGQVETATLVRRSEPTLDNNVLAAVRGWRYRPLLAGDAPVPFCTFVRFEFRAE